jgi:hypothetical protein
LEAVYEDGQTAAHVRAERQVYLCHAHDLLVGGFLKGDKQTAD